MTRPDLLILADDLTGALDSAAPFAAHGQRVEVRLWPLLAGDAPQVLALALDSRDVPEAEALARSAAALAAHPGARVFRKIDSRLKGHVAAEIAAALRATGAARVLLAPAIPELGRIVAGGAVRGAGVEHPIPLGPIIAALAPVPVLAPDTGTEAELDLALEAAGPDTLLAGARGLAGALARAMAPPQVPVLPPLAGPVLVVIGSRDPVTLAQVRHLRQARPDLAFVGAPGGQGGALPSGSAILQALPGPEASPAQVAARLAATVTPHLGRYGTLVLTGGDTASAVLRAAGIARLDLIGDALPGLPLCRPLDRDGPMIVTKSGGFGAPDTLGRLLEGRQ